MPTPIPVPFEHDAGLAGRQLIASYERLAARGEHLFASILHGAAPVQWEHYPADDARDPVSGYQWFYHAHSPEDRPGSAEHGHIHVFAREGARAGGGLVHLLAIGFDARGLPINLFTVNGWVTGAIMADASETMKRLGALSLDTGHEVIDGVITAVCAMMAPNLTALFDARDVALRGSRARQPLEDRTLEVLSQVPFLPAAG